MSVGRRVLYFSTFLEEEACCGADSMDRSLRFLLVSSVSGSGVIRGASLQSDALHVTYTLLSLYDDHMASPDSGHSGPHTPPRGQAPSVQHAKSSPVSSVFTYFLPENREQYQKFGYNASFLLGAFDDQSKFLQFLDLELPESIPFMGLGGKESFVKLANHMAHYVKNKREHCLFLYFGFLPTYDFHLRFPKP